MLTTILLTIVIIAFAIAGLAIKIIVKKDGEFTGTCSSNNPYLKNQLGECNVCGKKPEEDCKMPDDEGKKGNLKEGYSL